MTPAHPQPLVAKTGGVNHTRDHGSDAEAALPVPIRNKPLWVHQVQIHRGDTWVVQDS